jgi:hypothetical protein
MDLPPPPTGRARLRWGLPDVLLAWLAGVLLAIVFTGFAVAIDPSIADVDAEDLPDWYLAGALVSQSAAIVLALIWVSERKGQGSLGRDFGLVWPPARLHPGAVVGWIAAGAGLSLAAAVLLRPIAELADLDDSAQAVAEAVERAGGVGLAVLMLGVVLVAPVVEELLFRGALLRALQRRTTVPVAVFASAAVFAGVHVVGDPGSYYVVPGLLLLGLVAGHQAAKRGDLARSMLLHVGFNLLSAASLALG